MNAVDMLAYGQRMILETIDQFRTDDWQRVALGVWTTKDLVGHLGAFEARFADVLATFVDERPVSGLLGTDPATFNDDQAAVRRDWTVEAVLAELHEAHDRTLAYASRLPPERWREVGTIPWYGPEYSLDDLLVYTMYGHKREHHPQLEAVREAAERSR